MKMLPTLDDQQRRVLRAIVDERVIRGSELMRAAKVDAAGLSSAAQALLDYGLIEVSGIANDEEEVLYAVFSVRPSDSRFLKRAF